MLEFVATLTEGECAERGATDTLAELWQTLAAGT